MLDPSISDKGDGESKPRRIGYRRESDDPANDADHFVKCGCGALVDRCDFAQVMEYAGFAPCPVEGGKPQ